MINVTFESTVALQNMIHLGLVCELCLTSECALKVSGSTSTSHRRLNYVVLGLLMEVYMVTSV